MSVRSRAVALAAAGLRPFSRVRVHPVQRPTWSRPAWLLLPAGLLVAGGLSLSGPVPVAASNPDYSCGTRYGAIIVPASDWAGQLWNISQDGATYDVYSNFRDGSCDRLPYNAGLPGGDEVGTWGTKFQCAELAMRAADAEWGIAGQQAWLAKAWDGNASGMWTTGPRLGLTQVLNSNNAGLLPSEGR